MNRGDRGRGLIKEYGIRYVSRAYSMCHKSRFTVRIIFFFFAFSFFIFFWKLRAARAALEREVTATRLRATAPRDQTDPAETESV